MKSLKVLTAAMWVMLGIVSRADASELFSGIPQQTAFTETELTSGVVLFADVSLQQNLSQMAGAQFILNTNEITDQIELLETLGISLQDNSVRFNGNAFATVSGLADDTQDDFSITFANNASTGMIQALLKNIVIKNDNPTEGSRQLNVALINGEQTWPLANFATYPTLADMTQLLEIEFGDYYALDVVDIDADGDNDLFVGNADGSISFYQNVGTEQLPHFSLVVAGNPLLNHNVGMNASPEFIDFDGDGDLDLFVGSATGELQYFKNIGTNSSAIFAQQNDEDNPLGHFKLGLNIKPTFYDYDQDGDLDVVAVDSSGTVSFLKYAPSPIYADFGKHSGSGIFDGVVLGTEAHIEFIDLNGDERLDLVTSSGDGQLGYYLFDEDTAAFSEQHDGSLLPALEVSNSFAIELADFNNDGELDLLLAEMNSNAKLAVNTPSYVATVIGVNDAPQFVDVMDVKVTENQLSVTDIAAVDEEDETLTLTLTGHDAFYFSITDGNLSFLQPADFEQPADSDGNNDYELIVTATDSSGAEVQTSLTVVVTDVNEAPVITGDSAYFISENVSSVATLSIFNPEVDENTTMELSGDDASQFTVDENGTLSFISAADFDFPSDENQDNVYQLSLSVTDDAGNTGEFVTEVHIANVIEAVNVRGVDEVVIKEQQMLDADGAVLFPDIVMSDIGDRWTGETLTVTGFNNTDNVTFPELDGFIFVENQIVFDGDLVATIDDALNGQAGNDLQIEFSSYANGLIVSTLMQNLSVSTNDEVGSGNRSLSVTLTHPEQEPIRLVNHVEFERVDNTGLNQIDVGQNAHPVMAELTSTNTPQLVVGELLNELTFYEADESSVFANFVEVTDPTPFNNITVRYGNAPAFVDFDADGDLDLFIGESDGTVDFHQNYGSATVPNYIDIGANPLEGLDAGSYAVPTFVDLDADGDQDAVIANSDGQLYWFENSGNAERIKFDLAVQDSLLMTQYSEQVFPAFADLDKDGDYDLVLGKADGTLDYYQNDGNSAQAMFNKVDGNENLFASINLSGRASPSFSDVDADGDMDLILGDDQGQIHYFENKSGVLVNIENFNDAPVIAGDSEVSVSQHSLLVTQLMISDSDSNEIELSLSGEDASHFTIDDTGTLSLLTLKSATSPQDADQNNHYQVTVVAIDEQSASSQHELTVEIVAEQLVSLQDRVLVVVEGQQYVAEFDHNGSLNLSGADAQWFTLTDSQLSFIISADYEEPVDANKDNQYQVTLTDSTTADTYQLTVQLQDLNEAPVFSVAAEYSVEENQPWQLQMMASDPEGDAVNYQLSGDDAHLFAVADTGVVSANASFNYELPADMNSDNEYQFDVMVSDAAGVTSSQSLSLVVTDTNELSLSYAPSIQVTENNAFVQTVAAAHPDSAAAQYQLSGDDAALFEVNSAGELQFITPADFELPQDMDMDNLYQVSVSVSVGSDQQLANVTIQVVNEDEAASLALQSQYQIAEGQQQVADLVVSNQESDDVSIILSGNDSSLFAIVEQQLRFNVATDFESPVDADNDNVYLVNVELSDSSQTTVYNLAVNVTDVDEATEVTPVSSQQLSIEQVTAGQSVNLLAGVQVFDPEQDFVGYSVAVSGLLTEDTMMISYNAELAVDYVPGSGSILYQDKVVGSVDSTNNGASGQDLTISFNGNADSEAVSAVINAIQYQNEGGSFTSSRVIDAVLIDGNGHAMSLVNEINYQDIEFMAQLTLDQSFAFPVVVDIDNDNDVDLFVGREDGSLDFYANTGSISQASFGQASINPANGVLGGRNASPSFVDIDGDEDLDLFIGNSDGFVVFYENIGDKTAPDFSYQDLLNPFSGIDVGNNAKVTFVDLDNDADWDAVLTNSLGQMIYVENSGSATNPDLAVVEDYSLLTTELNLFDITLTFADVDGDQDADLLIGDLFGELYYFENIGTKDSPIFEEQVETSPFSETEFTNKVIPQLIDADGDGDIDLLVTDAQSKLYISENMSGLKLSLTGESVGNSAPTIKLVASTTADSGEVVTISANVSDVNDDLLTYSWQQVSGLSVSLSDRLTPTVTFTAPEVTEQQELVLELTVSDGYVEVTDQITVVVEATTADSTQPVISVATSSSISEGEAVQITASISNTTSNEVRAFWQQTSGPAVTIAEPTNLQLAFTAPIVSVDTELEFELQVTDGENTVSETVIVLVVNTNNDNNEEVSASSEAGSINLTYLLLAMMMLLVRRRVGK